jgi:hypothetical protein
VNLELTRAIEAAQAGDPRAAAELLPLVYAELRELAAQRLRREAGAPSGRALTGE